MLLVSLLTGCLFDSYNAKYEEEFDFYCTDLGETVYLDGQRFTSVTDAINQAQDGESVEICPGTYTENLLVDKNIRLVGRDKSGRVILEGDGNDSVIIATDGLTLQNVTVQSGGGFLNDGQTLGGGILGIDGTLDLKDVVIRGNYADQGGGLYSQGPAILENVTFNQNGATQTGGGAVFVDDTTLTNVDFLENDAQAGGGFAVGFGTVNMSGGSLEDNVADVGTAIALFEDAEAHGNTVTIVLTDGDAALLQTNSDNAAFATIGSSFSCSTRGSLRCN